MPDDSDIQYTLGQLTVNPALNQVHSGTEVIHLEPLLMNILVYLMIQAPRPVSADELLQRFWPDSVVEESTIHRRISQLRQALGDSPRQPVYIATVPKRGYHIVAAVTATETAELHPQFAATAPVAKRNWKTPHTIGAVVVLVTAVAAIGIYLLFEPVASDTDVVADSSLAQQQQAEEILLDVLHTIAVLPFSNVSQHFETESFIQGLNDQIIDRLAKTDFLNIVSQTSNERVGKRPEAGGDIASALDVSYVLQGSVQSDGQQQQQVVAQLIRTEDNFHVWSKIYNEDMLGGLDQQQNIAHSIARIALSELEFDIHRRYGGGGYGSLANRDPEAVKLFFKGENQFRTLLLGEGGDPVVGERLMTQALEIDPEFLSAHYHLANVYIHRLMGRLPYQTAQHKAAAVLARARTLSPEAADFIVFQEGQYHLFLSWDYAKAQAAFERQLQLGADCAWCYIFMAELSIRQGQLRDARSLLASGLAIGATVQDEEVRLLNRYAQLASLTGDDLGGRDALIHALSVPGGKEKVEMMQSLAINHLLAGETEQALQMTETAWQTDPLFRPEVFVYLFAQLGDHERATAMLDYQGVALRESGWLGLNYLALDRRAEALTAFKRGIAERSNFLATFMPASKLFEPLRRDVEFENLMQLLRANETF